MEESIDNRSCGSHGKTNLLNMTHNGRNAPGELRRCLIIHNFFAAKKVRIEFNEDLGGFIIFDYNSIDCRETYSCLSGVLREMDVFQSVSRPRASA